MNKSVHPVSKPQRPGAQTMAVSAPPTPAEAEVITKAAQDAATPKPVSPEVLRKREDETIKATRKAVEASLAAGDIEADLRPFLPSLDEIPRDAWLRDYPYVMGSVFMRAINRCRDQMTTSIKKAVVDTAKAKGPLVISITQVRQQAKALREQQAKALREKRDRLIEESRRSITAEYNQRINEAEAAPPPEILTKLETGLAQLDRDHTEQLGMLELQVEDFVTRLRKHIPAPTPVAPKPKSAAAVALEAVVAARLAAAKTTDKKKEA